MLLNVAMMLTVVAGVDDAASVGSLAEPKEVTVYTLNGEPLITLPLPQTALDVKARMADLELGVSGLGVEPWSLTLVADGVEVDGDDLIVAADALLTIPDYERMHREVMEALDTLYAKLAAGDDVDMWGDVIPIQVDEIGPLLKVAPAPGTLSELADYQLELMKATLAPDETYSIDEYQAVIDLGEGRPEDFLELLSNKLDIKLATQEFVAAADYSAERAAAFRRMIEAQAADVYGISHQARDVNEAILDIYVRSVPLAVWNAYHKRVRSAQAGAVPEAASAPENKGEEPQGGERTQATIAAFL